MKKINQGDHVSLKDGLQVGVQYGHLELLKGMAFTGAKEVNYARKNSVDIGKWTYSMEMIEVVSSFRITPVHKKLNRGALYYEQV